MSNQNPIPEPLERHNFCNGLSVESVFRDHRHLFSVLLQEFSPLRDSDASYIGRRLLFSIFN